MTPLLCPVWWAASVASFSRTTAVVRGLAARRARPVARPTIPPPMMTASYPTGRAYRARARYISGAMSQEHNTFRVVPRTGVIYVTTEATKLGFSPTHPVWCNLGQGQPETGDLPGAPTRVKRVEIATDVQEYAPVAGLWELREAVASLYNSLYRRGMPSSGEYSAENVCVSGRRASRRSRARRRAWGIVNLGHFLARLHRVRGAPRYLQGVHLDSDLARGRQGLRLRRRRSAPRDPRAAGFGAILLSNSVQPDRQARGRRRTSRSGSPRRAISTAR